MASNEIGYAFLLLVVGLVLCIIAAIQARYLRAKRIEGDLMHVAGVCPAMLEPFPQWTEKSR